MSNDLEIEKRILEESRRKVRPLAAHILTLPDFPQEEVKLIAQNLIDTGKVNATLTYHYQDLCAIKFKHIL